MVWVWVFPLVLVGLVCGFLALWLWSVYLETARASEVRFGLLMALLLGQMMEIMLYRNGFLFVLKPPRELRGSVPGSSVQQTEAVPELLPSGIDPAALAEVYNSSAQWMLLGLIFCNFWGSLDAVLRFPISHDLDNFFTIKILLLLLAKTTVYSVYFTQITKNVPVFLSALFSCIWAQPLLYVMALPTYDVPQPFQHSNFLCQDCDTLYKLWVYLKAFCASVTKQRERGPEVTAVCAETWRMVVWAREVAFANPLMPNALVELAVRKSWIDRRAIRKSGAREI